MLGLAQNYRAKNLEQCAGFYILLLRIQHLKSTEEIVQEKQIGDGFDKFRNKDKLMTKSEQIFDKKNQ